MNRTSLLILKTSCDFSALGNESWPLPFFWGETPDRSDRTIPMPELLSEASLVCDVAILPSLENYDEVHSGESESGTNDDNKFRESHDSSMNVISFPSQVLLPCGIDNLLQWPSFSTDSYILNVSNCVMEVSPSEMGSAASEQSFQFQLPLISNDSFQTVSAVENSIDLQIFEATQELFLVESSLDAVLNNVPLSQHRTISEDDDNRSSSEEIIPDEIPRDPCDMILDSQQASPRSPDSFWHSMCFEPSLTNDDQTLTKVLLEQNEELQRRLEWLSSLEERINDTDAWRRNQQIELLEKRLEKELASIQMIFHLAEIIPVLALVVACLWTICEYQKRHTKYQQRKGAIELTTVLSKKLEEALKTPMPSIAVQTGTTTTDTSSVAKSEEDRSRHSQTDDNRNSPIRPSLSRTKNTFNLVEAIKHSKDGQSQTLEEPIQGTTSLQQPMSPRTQLMTQFERKHPEIKTTTLLSPQEDSTDAPPKRRKNRLQPPMPITPDTTSRESCVPSSSLSSNSSLASGFFFSGPPSEIRTTPMSHDMNPRLSIDDPRGQPVQSSRNATGTFVDDYW